MICEEGLDRYVIYRYNIQNKNKRNAMLVLEGSPSRIVKEI